MNGHIGGHPASNLRCGKQMWQANERAAWAKPAMDVAAGNRIRGLRRTRAMSLGTVADPRRPCFLPRCSSAVRLRLRVVAKRALAGPDGATSRLQREAASSRADERQRPGGTRIPSRGSERDPAFYLPSNRPARRASNTDFETASLRFFMPGDCCPILPSWPGFDRPSDRNPHIDRERSFDCTIARPGRHVERCRTSSHVLICLMFSYNDG